MWSNAAFELAPRGGPTLGGTHVFISGRRNPTSGAQPFLDLGDARCRFHGSVTSPAVVVNRSLLACVTPACLSPDCHGTPADSAFLSVSIEVTMDGVYYTNSGRRFTYHTPHAWR